jgi:hypothetical protein
MVAALARLDARVVPCTSGRPHARDFARTFPLGWSDAGGWRWPAGIARHYWRDPDLPVATPPGATLNYGIFINNVIKVLILAFVVFLVVQQMNRLTRKPAPVVAATTKDCPQCAMPIRLAAKRCGDCTAQLA